MTPDKWYIIIISVILIAGIIIGLQNWNLKIKSIASIHYIFSSFFILAIVIGLYLQWQRVKLYGRFDFVSISHIVIFFILITFSVKAIVYHSKKVSKMSGGGTTLNSDHFIVTHGNKKYDIASFVKDHPGGNQILKAKNYKTLEEAWKDNGVWELHNNNETVMNVLKKHVVN